MSSISGWLTAPSLWYGAAAGGLLSATVAGYFTRSVTKDSDRRMAEAERERIDKDAVRDAAIEFASTCKDTQISALRYPAGLLPDVPVDDLGAGTYRLDMAVALGNQLATARFKVEMIAPRPILLTLWPLYAAAQDEITSSFAANSDVSHGIIFDRCLTQFICAVREYLGKEAYEVDDVTAGMASVRNAAGHVSAAEHGHPGV